jgi:ribosomal protein L7/L12
MVIENDVAALQRRVGLLEQQVKFLMEHLGVEYEPETDSRMPAEVVELIQRNNLIEAIRVYRQITGAGLQEAKIAIDSYTQSYNFRSNP